MSFAGKWSYVFWNDLGELSVLEACVIFSQACLFFVLMFSEPFILDDSLPYCDKYRYISENISVQKGVASVLIFLMYPSWLILTGIASQISEDDFFFYRGPCTMLATTAFLGALQVLLYDQDIASTLSPAAYQSEIERQHRMHLIGALLLSTSFVFGQLFISLGFRAPDTQRWPSYLIWLSRVLCSATAVVLGLNAILYEYGTCKTTAVWLEYFLYFLIGLSNISLYLTFTAIHTIHKMENNP